MRQRKNAGSPDIDINGDKPLRTRLDILIALMVLQILLSIAIWVQTPSQTTSTPEMVEEMPEEQEYTEPVDEYSTPENQETDIYTEPVVEPETTEPQSPDWSNIRIDVLNGCGVTGIAGRAQKWLKRNGYKVRLAENADRHDYKQSIIQDRSGNYQAALELARALNLNESNIMELRGSPSPYVDLTLVIGLDYKRLPIDN